MWRHAQQTPGMRPLPRNCFDSTASANSAPMSDPFGSFLSWLGCFCLAKNRQTSANPNQNTSHLHGGGRPDAVSGGYRDALPRKLFKPLKLLMLLKLVKLVKL